MKHGVNACVLLRRGQCNEPLNALLTALPSLMHTPHPPRFITAMAANPLAVNLAAAEGIAISWGAWALAGLVPGFICLTTVPLILYALYPPGGCWR